MIARVRRWRCLLTALSLLLDVRGATSTSMALPLPAGATVALAPGKIRLALGRIARTLRIGDRVPLTLVIRDVSGGTQQIEVDAEVRLHSPTEDHRRRHTHAPPRA